MLSLRARVFLGAVLWSFGLLLFSGMVLTHYMLYVPGAPGIFHGVFIHYMIVIAFAILTAYAFKLAVLGADKSLEVETGRFPVLARIAAVVGLYVIALCAINFVSVILQCGLGECHTEAYRLLQ